MTDRYIAFDVETPNAANDRMSAIGITVVENGRIVDAYDTLVNPECHFDTFNVELTGITPQKAAGAPTFDELWPAMEELFQSGLLIAHNAPFDMSVLSKCLRAYGIQWKARVDYACTCQMGRRCYPYLQNHRLNTLCDYLGITLDHHQAGSDSYACAALLCDYLSQGMDVEAFRRTYDMIRSKTVSSGGSSYAASGRNRNWRYRGR